MPNDPPPSAPPTDARALGRRTARSGLAAYGGQAVRFAVLVVSQMALARLLLPEDYGIAGMVTSFTGLLAVLNDSNGLSLATIQKSELAESERNAAFWLQVGLSVLLAGSAVALAPLIGAFYNEPRASWMAVALAPTFLLVGAYQQHQALLRRDLRVPVLTAIEVTAAIVGALAAVAVAAAGAGYWALVAQPTAQYLFSLPALWIASGWRPGAPAIQAARAHVGFGGNFTVYKIVEYTTKNADKVILGRLAGAVEVGLYGRATSFLTLPLTQMSFPMSLLVLPSLSRLQADPPGWRAFYLGAARVLGWLSLPLAVLLFVEAEDVVSLVLGPKWTETVPIFRYAGLGVLVIPLTILVNWLYLSLGRTDRMLRWGLVAGALALLATVLGAPYGAEGVALGRSLAAAAALLGGLVHGVRGTSLSLGDIGRSLAPPLLGALAVGAAAAAVSALVPPHPLLRLAAASAAAGATLAGGLWLTGDHRKLYALARRTP